jgi:predicted nucleic acid-binding protein
MKSVIDSSVWIEQVRAGFDEGEVLEAMDRTAELVVPTITLLEVRKWLLRFGRRQQGAELLGWMMFGQVADLTPGLAMDAAAAGVKHRLALADSIIYATARMHEATLWTMDKHFEGLPGVRMVKGAPG